MDCSFLEIEKTIGKEKPKGCGYEVYVIATRPFVEKVVGDTFYFTPEEADTVLKKMDVEVQKFLDVYRAVITINPTKVRILPLNDH